MNLDNPLYDTITKDEAVVLFHAAKIRRNELRNRLYRIDTEITRSTFMGRYTIDAMREDIDCLSDAITKLERQVP